MVSTPLLSGHDEDTVDLEQREKLLADRLPSIAHITERFVTRLGERSELLPVARVKRPARRAIERLAAHTEDWAGRTLAGPVPRRALAVTRELDANLYENRMVTELVHPILSTAMVTRIRRLRRLVSDLADLKDAQHVGTHRRTSRLYSFWGEDASKAAENHVHAGNTLEVLEKVAAWIQSLRASTLSRALKGKVTGQRSLRRTNVINNDRHYRSAGEVWTAYERPEVFEESHDERQRRLTSRHRAFDQYVLGLVVRGLRNLGYAPLEQRLPAPGGHVDLSGTWGTATLHRRLDGVLELTSQGVTTRFVPLLDLVGPDDDALAVALRWSELRDIVDRKTVVVYLGASTAIRAHPNRTLAAALSSAVDDGLEQGGHLTGIPVSPLETTSLERVARGVALAVLTPPLMAYPPALNVADSALPQRIVDHLAAANIGESGAPSVFHQSGKTLRLRRPLVAAEQARLTGVVGDLTAATRSTGWQRDLGPSISLLQAAFDSASTQLAPLLGCPVCSAVAEPRQFTRDGDVFLIECRSCSTRWGHERCGNCQARIPIVEPSQELLNPEVAGPGWVERVFGQEALASPCWARKAANRYICPECRVCPLKTDALGSECGRCHRAEVA
ncbi:hypothetical protein [Agromyces humi]|uniref:hypothetical protein n=1 Tax=Agromyces humi TaxID=1766800 RepID=UPI001357260A|nr:hypothetical protein [Agromyces humi]